MKILLVSPTQSGIGGTAKHVQGLINYLESKNHFVKINFIRKYIYDSYKKLKKSKFYVICIN